MTKHKYGVQSYISAEPVLAYGDEAKLWPLVQRSMLRIENTLKKYQTGMEEEFVYSPRFAGIYLDYDAKNMADEPEGRVCIRAKIPWEPKGDSELEACVQFVPWHEWYVVKAVLRGIRDIRWAKENERLMEERGVVFAAGEFRKSGVRISDATRTLQ